MLVPKMGTSKKELGKGNGTLNSNCVFVRSSVGHGVGGGQKEGSWVATGPELFSGNTEDGEGWKPQGSEVNGFLLGMGGPILWSFCGPKI